MTAFLKTKRAAAAVLSLCLVGIPAMSPIAKAETAHGSYQAVTDQAVTAAKAFLATLDNTQRKAAVFAIDDEQQRQRWSNLPTSMVHRNGLRLGDLKPEQLAAAQKLLKALLSPSGYEKVVGIMNGDEVLKREEGSGGPGRRGGPGGPGGPPPGGPGGPQNGPPPGGRGTGPGGAGGLTFGKDEYYISFVGAPSSTDPWMLQWGGHHLALNITVDGPHGVLTPTHTATQPAKYTWEGKTVRPLGAEYDKAIAFISTLNEEQRKKAIIGSQMADLVLGPGHDGQTIQPEGLKAAEMTETQQAAVLDLAHEWVGILNDVGATAKMAELKANIRETWFAWSGPTTPGSAFYYRIQGPTVVIEFSPQRLGGDPVNHIHTMFRDPSNDYGKKWWKK